jgi:hypothetical protein
MGQLSLVPERGDSAMNRPVSFGLHIRPLFRADPDVTHMKRKSIDLSSYDDVRDNSDEILRRLKLRDQYMMPPASADGPWPDEWIALFERWIKEGYAK